MKAYMKKIKIIQSITIFLTRFALYPLLDIGYKLKVYNPT